jgi:hypothetical protein
VSGVRFYKLTVDGDPTWINPVKVVAFYSHGKGTKVCTDVGTFYVDEGAKTVFNLLDDSY